MKYTNTFVSRLIVVLISCGLHSQSQNYLMPTGNPTLLSSWNSKPDGTGSAPLTFGGANRTWHFQVAGSRTAEVLTSEFDVHSTSTIVIGTGFALTFNGNGVTNAWINASSGGTLEIQNNKIYKLADLNVNSWVIYSAPTPSVGSARQARPYGNLRIATSVSLSPFTGTRVIVAGQLFVDAAQTLSLGSVPLELTGGGSTIFGGTGQLRATANSTLRISGGNGGDNGTLTLAAAGNTLRTIEVNFNSGADYFTLGSDLGVNTGTFALRKGGIDLNGNKLRINANVEFPATANDGGFLGTPTSEIHLRPLTYVGTDNIFFNPSANSLGVLSLNTSSLSLTIGNQLTIHDSLAVLDGMLDANGNVTIEATALQKGRISRIGGGGSIVNDVTFRTFISGGLTGWMLLGPTVDGLTVADWDTWVSTGHSFGIPMTCTGCSYPPTTYNPAFTSIQGWDEPSDDYVTNFSSSTSLPLGTGVWAYVGDGNTATNDLTLLTTGAIGQGLVFTPLTASGPNSDHWNLVSNPFPSPISWSKVHDLTNAFSPGDVGAEMHIFSPDNGYGTYVAKVGGTNGLTDILPAGQGFYVTVSNATNLFFDEDCKMDDQTTDLWKSSSAIGAKNQEYFKLKVSGAYGNDETMINFDRLATKGFDRLYDGHKIFVSAGYSGYGDSYSKYTTISTRDEMGEDYAINSMPPLTASVTIPVLVRVMATGSHTISLSETENFGSCLILFDKVTNQYHDLKASPYVFDIEDTTSAPRFELTLCQSESEPVVSVEELNAASQISIGSDRDGAFVKTAFRQPTKATISAFNIVGQKLMEDMEVIDSESLTRLPVELKNQVVVIRVTTDFETRVKKVILH